MRAFAEVDEVSLTVSRRTHIMADFIIHYLQFEGFEENISLSDSLSSSSSQSDVLLHQFFHPLLYLTELLVSDWIHCEVIVEPVLYRRSDCGFGIRIKLSHRLSQKMCATVP